MELEAKNLGTPDDARSFEHGSLSLVAVGGATIGLASFLPGWRWSADMKPIAGTDSCQVEHTGYVISGRLRVRTDDGREMTFGPGDAHAVPAGHDAWVEGSEPCVIVDFAAPPAAGLRGTTCPCGVMFQIRDGADVEHLVDAVRQHAAGSHGHEVTREHVLAEIG